MVQRELGPLANDDDEMRRIAATLRVYFEEGSSLERAARRLGVHKNTVNNRVRRARELLGENLAERPLEVQVALVLSRIVLSDQSAYSASISRRVLRGDRLALELGGRRQLVAAGLPLAGQQRRTS